MMNNHKDQWVMILEQTGINLKAKQMADNVWILEGVFAEFGVENNNKRIYEEKEYLPHLEYLQEKIKAGALYGELDHPEKFETSLKNVSHLVESLWFDEKSRTVRGRIKLLETEPHGNNAIAILKGGGQLSISSRAAGVVKEDKKVQIKRIFAYDLVAEPGFKNAQLDVVSESNKDVKFSAPLINEQLGLESDSMFAVYDMSEAYNFDNPSVGPTNEENKNENINMNKELVTREAMDAYSTHLKEEFARLESLILKMGRFDNNDNPSIYEDVKKLKAYAQKTGEEINNLVGYAEYGVGLSEEIRHNMESFARKTNENFEIADRHIENTNENFRMADRFIDNVNENFRTADAFIDNVNENFRTADAFIENVNENFETADDLMGSVNEDTNNLKKHTTYLAEKMNESIAYSESIAEELEVVSDHSDYLSERLNHSINYSERIAENVNHDNGYVHINESNRNTNRNNSLDINNLNNSVDTILENAKKQKAEYTQKQNNFPYFRMLNEQQQREFLDLPSNQKQMIIEKSHQFKPMNEHDVIDIIQKVITPKEATNVMESLINEMPSRIQNAWETSSQPLKNAIMEQAKFYNLTTPQTRRNFWLSRKSLNEKVEIEKLNENITPVINEMTEEKFGYSNDYISGIVAKAKRLRK